MRSLGGLLLALLALAAASAWAQPAAPAASLATALEAQYRAAVLRDRRLADERALLLIAEAETRMRTARSALAAASGDRAHAQAALEEARSAYTQLVMSLPLQNAAVEVEVEAFRAEVEGRLPEATPALLEAYREFADGDRASAWSALETLLRARAAARTAAARAVAAAELRELASLREIMRSNGEATLTDVLALLQAATDLDPSYSPALTLTSELAKLAGDLPRARAAAAAALAAARTDTERRRAHAAAGDSARDSNDLPAAARHYRAAVDIAVVQARQDPRVARDVLTYNRDLAEALVATDQLDAAGAEFDRIGRLIIDLQGALNNDPMFVHDVAALTSYMGDVQSRLNRYEEALTLYRASSEAMRRASQLLPSHTGIRGNLGVALTMVAQFLTDGGRYDEALPLAQEAIALYRGLLALDAGNGDWQANLAIALDTAGDAHDGLQRPAEARRLYQEARDIRVRRLAEDPSNSEVAMGLAVSLSRLGDLASATGQDREALAAFTQQVEITRGLYERDPSNSEVNDLLFGGLLSRGPPLENIGEHAAAVRATREAAEFAQRLAAGNPDVPELHINVIMAMAQLAALGELPWADVRARITELEQRGMFDHVRYGALARMADEALRQRRQPAASAGKPTR